MAQAQDKKTTIILLIVLAVSIIGGGIWTFTSLQDTDISLETLESDSLAGLSIEAVFKVKEEAIYNIKDFLQTEASPDTIWSNFYADPQFNRLKSLDINIDIANYKNNYYPFTIPSSTKKSLQQ